MNAWNYTGAPHPWAPFGIDADLVFSWDVSAWVASAGPALTLQSAEMVLDERLQLVGAVSLEGSVITARVKRSEVAATIGAMMKLRLHMTLSDGQHDDRNFLLKLVER